MSSIRPYLRMTTMNAVTNNFGGEGYVAFDSSYFYIFSNNVWRRSALSPIINPLKFPIEINASDRAGLKDGFVCYTREYFYVYYNGWKSIALSPINPELTGRSTFSIKSPIKQLRIVTESPITQITYGQEGYVAFDKYYFYMFGGRVWRKFALSTIPKSIITVPITGSNWEDNSDNWENADYTWDDSANLEWESEANNWESSEIYY